MEAVLGKLVGKLGPQMWAQVYDFMPETEEKMAARGRMVAVVSMETGRDIEQVEMVQSGREILARLHEQYFGEETGSAFEVLKEAIGKVREEFSQVEITAAAMVGNILYIVASEGAGVYVCRQGKQGWLVRPGNTGKEQVTFSGRGEVNEVIVLGNIKFWRGVTEGMLRAAVAAANEEMESGVETLAAMERGNEMAGGEAGVMLKLTNVNEVSNVIEPEIDNNEQFITSPVLEDKKEKGITMLWKGLTTTVSRKLAIDGWVGKIYIRHGDKQNQRRKMMYLGVIFLVWLLIMAGVGQVLIKQKNQQSAAVEVLIEKLTDDFREAKADATLNPSRSRQLLTQIKTETEQLKKQGIKDTRIESVNSEYNQVWQEASGIVKLVMTELLDLNLVRAGIGGSRLAMDDRKLEILDSVGGRVIEVDIKTEAGRVVAGGENWKGARIIAIYPAKIYVVADSGIMMVTAERPVVEKNSIPYKITDMKVYAGNIYILDSSSRQIWRLSVNTAGTFGKGQPWLAEKNGDEEIGQGTGMAIDGSIWVIKPGGLVKYTRGAKEAITVSGLENNWGDGAVLFTDENTQKLYVLDPVNKRVVVTDKSGQYEKQYQAENLGAARDLVVDENAGRMYFVGGTKVWAANL